MKRQRKYSYFGSMLLCLLLSCDDKLDWIQQLPEVFGLSPNTGLAGDIVIISGDEFSTIADQNTVTINGVTATIISATATTLEVEVPPGSSGPVIVTVNGQIANNKPTFTYRIIPVIVGLTPNSGIVGSEIVISGSNFSTNVAENTVTINGTEAMIVSATSTTLTVIAPEESTGVVVVTVNGEQSGEDPTFVYEPEIFSISPLEGRAGTVMTISGRNFGATPAENEVMLGTTTVMVTTATTTTLTLVVPEFAYPQPLETSLSVDGYEAATKPEFNLEFLVSTLPIAPFLDRIIGLDRDAFGNFYAILRSEPAVYKIAPNGTVSVFADASDGLGSPQGIALDGFGNLFVSNIYDVYKLNATGTVVQTTGTGVYGNVNGPGAVAQFSVLAGIAALGTTVYVSDVDNDLVRAIDNSNNVTTAVDLIFGSAAWPIGLAGALDNGGNLMLFMATNFGVIKKFDASDGSIEILPLTTGIDKFDLETDSDGAVYAMGRPKGLIKVLIEGGVYTDHVLVDYATSTIDGLTSVATVQGATAFATDEDNVLYFADELTNSIRKVEK